MQSPLKLGYQSFREALAESAGRALPVRTGDPETAQRFADQFEQYAGNRTPDAYDCVHHVRFRETVRAFGGYLVAGGRVLELGGHGRIGVFARDVFGCAYSSYEKELREPYDLPDDDFDVVLCLEVIEHLKDIAALEADVNDIGCWNYSGVLNCLRESFRILKTGGLLLVTTPNAASTDVFARTLAGDHPHMFDPHVRELAPKQVKAFAELVGFHLEMFGTFYAWGECTNELRQKILGVITSLGFDPQHRGDDAFYAFRKP